MSVIPCTSCRVQPFIFAHPQALCYACRVEQHGPFSTEDGDDRDAFLSLASDLDMPVGEYAAIDLGGTGGIGEDLRHSSVWTQSVVVSGQR